MLNITKLCS